MPVEFEGEQNIGSQFSNKPKYGALTKLLIKLNLAKDEKTAQIVFVVTAILCILLSVLILAVYVFGFSLIPKKTVDYSNLTPEQRSRLPLIIQKTLERQKK